LLSRLVGWTGGFEVLEVILVVRGFYTHFGRGGFCTLHGFNNNNIMKFKILYGIWGFGFLGFRV